MVCNYLVITGWILTSAYVRIQISLKIQLLEAFPPNCEMRSDFSFKTPSIRILRTHVRNSSGSKFDTFCIIHIHYIPIIIVGVRRVAHKKMVNGKT